MSVPTMRVPGIERVEIHCDAANTASAAVARAVGYRLDRVDDREIATPNETGRSMIWLRTPGALSPGG